MILGFVGYLVSWTDGIIWPELSITVIVLGAVTFVFSAVPVAHQETFDKVLAALPEGREATLRDAYYRQEGMDMVEAYDDIMRAALPFRLTLYVVAGGYAGVVLIKPTLWVVVVSTVVLAGLLAALLTELRASLGRRFAMAVRRLG